jgi:hypothetical protein
LRFELAIESPASQVGDFIIGREADGDKLSSCELADPTPEIIRQKSFEAATFLEADYPILCSERHGSNESNADEERESDNYGPPGNETGITDKLNCHYDDVDQKNRQREEMEQRNPSPVGCVGLRDLRHRSSL